MCITRVRIMLASHQCSPLQIIIINCVMIQCRTCSIDLISAPSPPVFLSQSAPSPPVLLRLQKPRGRLGGGEGGIR